MLNLFKKKDPGPAVTDKIWMTEPAKFNALLEEWKKDKNTVFLFWFDETLRKAETFFAKETSETVTLLKPRETSTPQLIGKQIILAEHYPLREKETELFTRLDLKKVTVWSALDEPLFMHFGGEKITQMMKQLGMKEDQSVENSMISNAIRNAQEKIGKKVVSEQTAMSQEDWLKRNLA